MVEFILGGARSGKSTLAEQRAIESGLSVVYIATGQAGDGEMAQRIDHHQARRPAQWLTVEEPLHVANIIAQHSSPQHCVLVDCVTLWLTNLLFAGKAAQQAEAGHVINCPLLTDETGRLLHTIAQAPGKIILVSNEVGMGVVPMGAINRLFVDEQGRLNQQLARLATRVTLVVAGVPVAVKA